jgi:hypothetical protein
MTKKGNTPAEKTTLTINEAAREFDLSAMYVRKAVRTGDLPTTLVAVKEGSATKRHEIDREAFIAWRAKASTHSKREDGRSRFILYATPEELEAVKATFADLPIVKPVYGKKEAEVAAE